MGPWTWTILAAYLAILAFEYLLEYLNIRSITTTSAAAVPEEFAPYVDADVQAHAEEYAAESARFGVAASLYNNAILLGFVFGGGLRLYDSRVESLGLGFVAGGVVFFLPLILARVLLNIPIGLYRAFVLEKRHGFSSVTMTPGLWFSDLFKSTAVSLLLALAAVAGGLTIVKASPTLWWLWLWAFFLAAGLFIMYLSPRVIEPLFNRFTPMDDPAMVESIKALMARAGIRVTRVFKMDASKRTVHTNAYFAGIGGAKRIVLYDTILEKLDADEVLAVLAHEAGHWTGRHLAKRLAVMETLSLAALYAAFLLTGGGLTGGGLLNTLFSGVLQEAGGGGTFYAGVFVLAILGGVALFPITPLLLYLSRRHELEADAVAARLTAPPARPARPAPPAPPGPPASMVSAIAKLARDNLSTLHPHPLYVAFRYTHPPAIERVRALKGPATEGSGPGDGSPVGAVL